MARRKKAPGIGVDELRERVGRRGVDPVYLVSGADDYLRRLAFGVLADAVAGRSGDLAAMAIERIDGATASLPEILDRARSLPLFLELDEGPAQLLWVFDFDVAAVEDTAPLEAYLQSPVEATCLVFEAARLDARRAAAKLLGARATRVECEPPESDAELVGWIRRAAEGRGYRIAPEAVAYMVEMVGPDLQQLHQEMEKVSLYVGERPAIEARDLEQLLGRSREHSVFELTDALVRGDTDVAIRTLNWLLDDGEEELRIFAMMCWIARELVKGKDLAGKRLPERQALKLLGGRWDQRRRVLERARRSRGGLEELLVECAEADRAVKVGRGGAARGALEALCRRLCAA